MAVEKVEEVSEKMETNQSFGEFPSFSEYQKVLLRSIMELTKAANALPPPGEKYEYFSSFPLFRQVMKAEGTTILKLMSTLTGQHLGKRNLFQMSTTDNDEKIDLLTEVNDILLERAAIDMDAAKGVKKESDIQLTTVSKKIETIWNQKNEKLKRDSAVTLWTAASIPRPQVSFPDKIDNSNSPFVPVIKDKPHALKPLAILVETVDGQETYSHPYEVEIEAFKPTDDQLKVNIQEPKPLGLTPLIMVDTEQSLKNMMDDLRQCPSIAMDLEHHSFRSFMGFTCLIQISTIDKDYIVDSLILRGHLHVLNEVTANPKIVKVLHGANMDIQWLQRDFGVYVVNLFDTGIAAKLLNYDRLSLSFLLKKYASVESDKRFQLVDWRIRPLPQEMVDYARTDTHYLLYIYEKLKEDLISSSNSSLNLLTAVWERSSQVCLKRYQKTLLGESSHLNFLQSANKKFNDKQKYALKHIFEWRDKLARDLDESTGYILPNHMLLQICDVLPREIQGIVACCNPCPPLVKQQLNELHQIILRAREIQLVNPLAAAPRLEIPKASINQIDFNNILHVVHDVPATGDQHDDARLPTLIDEAGNLLEETRIESKERAPRMKKSSLLPDSSQENSKRPLSSKLYVTDDGKVLRAVTPFERYTAQIKKLEEDDKALDSLMEESKAMAEQLGNEASEDLKEDQPAIDAKVDEEPTVIRGKQKKRRRDDDSSIMFNQNAPAKKLKKKRNNWK